MNYAMLVQVLQSVDDLGSVTLHFEFMKAFSTLEQFVHTLVLAELQENVDILAVLKKVLKVAHISMFDAAVDFDLTHQFLLGPALRQAGLLDHLSRMHKARIGIYELIAFGETTLAQEFPLDVASDADFGRAGGPHPTLFEFLLNYGLR